MIRKTLLVLLWVGLVCGLALAAAKTIASASNPIWNHRDPRIFEDDDAAMGSTILISQIPATSRYFRRLSG